MKHILRIDEMSNKSKNNEKVIKSFVEYVYDDTHKNEFSKDTWYHITTTPNIDKFKIMPKSGFGTNFYGRGIYFTHIPEVIDYYAELIGSTTYVYIVKFKNTANIVDEYDEKGGKLYLDLMEKYNDEERVSKMMRTRYKIDGITYYNEEDGESVVIFNPNVIQILNKVELNYSPNENGYYD